MSVCQLGTSTNDHFPFSLAAVPKKESNIKFTYRDYNCSLRLFPAPGQCGCFSRVGPFTWHVTE